MTVILKFKAGKVDYDENTEICTPKPLKGEITIKKTEDDESFYDFVWSSREKTAGASTSSEDDELLIIPGDVEWKHVKSCKSGRVFCLYFNSGQKSFYWMQDRNDNSDDSSELSAKDKEISKKILELITEEEDEGSEVAIVPDESNSNRKGEGEQQKEEPSAPKKPIASISNVFPSHVISDYVNNKLTAEKLDDLLSIHLPAEYFEGSELVSMSEFEKRQELIQVLTGGFYRSAEGKLSSALARGAGGIVSQAFHFDYNGEGIENFLDAVRKQGLKEKENEKKKD